MSTPGEPLYGAALHGDPADRYARLRSEHGPVVPVALTPDVPAWLVLGHRELLHVARDEENFSHDPRRWAPVRDGRVAPDSPLVPMSGWRPAVLYADGGQHRRMRAAVGDALGRVDGHGLVRTTRAVAERLVAGFAGAGRADLVAQYAATLPLRVLGRLLGLDDEAGVPRLVEAVTGTAASGATAGPVPGGAVPGGAVPGGAAGRRAAGPGGGTVDRPHRSPGSPAGSFAGRPTGSVLGAGKRLSDLLRELVLERKRRPAADLTSWLLAHDARLTDDEVLHHLVVLLATGHRTTARWITSTVHRILTDPAFRSSRTGGHRTVEDALDLVLWHRPPAPNVPGRYATRDLRIGDRNVRAGDLLVLGVAGANADPEALPESGCPAIGNRSYLSFGAGPHACPAPDQARLIARTAVDTLQHRLPDLALAVQEDEVTWLTSPWSQGPVSLPVRFSVPPATG